MPGKTSVGFARLREDLSEEAAIKGPRGAIAIAVAAAPPSHHSPTELSQLASPPLPPRLACPRSTEARRGVPPSAIYIGCYPC